MDTLSYVTLFLAIATFVLAGVAVASILQTRNIQKSEKRERLLNEIIEWVKDVSDYMPIFPSIKYAEIKNEWEYNIMIAGDEISKLISLENQGEYIRKIAGKFREDLGNAVYKVLSNIKERKMLLIKLMSVKPAIEKGEMKKWSQYLSNKNQDTWNALSEEGKAHVNLGENAGELKKYISKVIEIAVEIKTKDIS